MNMSLNDIGKDNGYGEKTLNQMFQSQLVEVLKNIKNPMTDEGGKADTNYCGCEARKWPKRYFNKLCAKNKAVTGNCQKHHL